jgi:HSP20 family protein
MSLTRWDPFGEVTSLRQAMDRLIEDSFVGRRDSARSSDSVPLDLIEQDDALVVRASMPGVRAEDVEVSVQGSTLSITGEMRGDEKLGDGARYHRRERWYGRFSRQITLPVEVQADACNATFEGGVLTITLPKSEQARPRRINVRGNGRETIEGTRAERTATPGTG